MLRRCILILTTFFILLTSTYAVAYYDPTPENNGKLSADPVIFRAYDQGVNITNCNIEINGQTYNMTYSLGYCSYNISGPDFITPYTFRIYYNNSASSLLERDFTYYPSKEKLREVPFASTSSLVVASLLLLGGLVFS